MCARRVHNQGNDAEIKIPEHNEETVRLACAEMATCLNQLREKPREDMDSIIEDATYLENYITDGATVTVNVND